MFVSGSEPEMITNTLSNLTISNPPEDNYDDEGQRKLFVGGLSWQTDEDGLQNYFESLDIPVERVIIMRDKMTGRSRGFGFVTLQRIEDIDRAVNSRLHLGRKIEAKRAIPKRDMDNNTRKLFVGGIPISLTNTEFRQYFEKFGAVADAQIMTERQTGHSRGFGFITFEDDEVARNALKARHVIQGKMVEVKKAQPKKVERPPIHIVHPYPMPFFPPYASMYPAPIYGSPGFYQPPMVYDPYFMGQTGGVIYAPHFVDTAYNSHVNPRTSTSTPRTSTRKSSTDVFSPSLVRPVNNQSRLSRRSQYARTSSSHRSSLVIPPERTERAWSADPTRMLNPAFYSPKSVLVSPISNNARRRGMSHPPINNRTSSPVIPYNMLNKPTLYTGITVQPNRRNSSQPKEETTLHKYFQ